MAQNLGKFYLILSSFLGSNFFQTNTEPMCWQENIEKRSELRIAISFSRVRIETFGSSTFNRNPAIVFFQDC